MINKVAVIGPNADNRYNMLGDYTAPQEDSNVKTVLDGIITNYLLLVWNMYEAVLFVILQ